jgi:hypothetical protein
MYKGFKVQLFQIMWPRKHNIGHETNLVNLHTNKIIKPYTIQTKMIEKIKCAQIDIKMRERNTQNLKTLLDTKFTRMKDKLDL